MDKNSRFEYDCIGKPINIKDKNIKWKNTVLTPEEAEQLKKEIAEYAKKKNMKEGKQCQEENK